MSTADERDIEIARQLVLAGVPIFVAYPDPATTTGFRLPKNWQKTMPRPGMLGAWKPGMALCAVMGHGLDLVDVDPRNGGDLANLPVPLPRVYGEAETPSGGRHLLIKSLDVNSRDGVVPGLDLKAGTKAGEGRGFGFISPTRRVSKSTGEITPYNWVRPPCLDGIEDDTSGAELREFVLSLRKAKRTVSGDADELVTEGSRHRRLLALAGAMRRQACGSGEILAALCAFNERRCSPPLPDDEVADIARDIPNRYPPDPDEVVRAEASPVTLDDFRAYMPTHTYLYIPTRELWPSSSVNARLHPVPTGKKTKEGQDAIEPASAWLDRNHAVEQMAWSPGAPMLIRDRLLDQGGWVERAGTTCFNLYRPPTIPHGDPLRAGPWLEHVHRIYPDEAGHILDWLAHRVQRPHEKVNHALVLGGAQGVGKDTLLEPVKQAIGPWNFSEVSPLNLLGRFNSFVKSVVLRVSEARDLGDADRYGFYEHMKVYTAAPPDVLRCDEKNVREYNVVNVCGVVLTTNHKTGGIFLPPDDRRHFVAWSDARQEGFQPGYWQTLYRWFEKGGAGHVAAFLAARVLDDFDAKAPPPKTEAWHDIVDSNRAPEDAELTDALDWLNWPAAVCIEQIASHASESFGDWLTDRRNSRNVPHRLEEVGYVPVRNDSQTDGRWKSRGKNIVVYGKRELSIRDRIAAARQFVEERRSP